MQIIQTLAERAKKSIPKDQFTVDQWIEQYNRHLALLILEECHLALNPMIRDMISRGQAMDLIRQHFGVEE